MKTREELLNEMDKFRRTLTSGQSKVLQSGLHQILSAPTEEQMKCKYCHGKADLNDTANSDFQLNIDTAENEIDVGYEFESGNDYCNFRIHYCPMCGRKLGDE